MGIAITVTFMLLMWLYFSFYYEESQIIPEMMICVDTNIFYDIGRDKIIIKIPFKKTIFLPEIFRRNHNPVYLNRKTYQFYEDYVMVNYNSKVLLKKG